ncbi:MAG: VCBS repeat-containing protein [Planctomycetota bacterium]
MIAVSRAGDTVAWWQNLDGSGGAWLKRVIDSAVVRASAVTAADLDGDGSLDVIGCSFNASDVYWWRNVDGQGTTWSRATIDAALGGAQSVAAADIDGDGDLDVVGNGENADDVTWYANQDGQGGAWQRTTIDASFDGANFVVTGDVDHDGDVDVASAARNGDEIAWWENLGGQGQSWTKHSVVTGFDLAAGTDLADVDGDGDLDVLGVAFNSNTIAWWENADAVGTTWTQHLVDTDFTFAIYVEGADVDRDGDIDLVGAAHNQGEISWFENLDGKGTQWLEHPVTVGFTIVTSSVARDIDGDGDLDVLGVAAVADAVEWWENRGGQVAFATTSTAPPSLTEGATDDVLKIVSSHRGRAGDGDLLLGSIDLLLEETPGTPLTSAQADAVFRKISIYLDDGSGAFEPALDRLVTSVSQFTLASGVLTVPLAAGAPAQSAVDSKVRIAATTSRSYFVVVELEGDAADHGIGSFAITHRPLSDRAFDLDFRLPLALEYALAVSSGVITIVNG